MFIKRNPKQSSVIKRFVTGIPLYFIPEYYNAQTISLTEQLLTKEQLVKAKRKKQATADQKKVKFVQFYDNDDNYRPIIDDVLSK